MEIMGSYIKNILLGLEEYRLKVLYDGCYLHYCYPSSLFSSFLLSFPLVIFICDISHDNKNQFIHCERLKCAKIM